MCDPGPGREEREGIRREGKGLEVPRRGSSFNTRTRLLWGRVGAGGAGVGWAGAGGRPCSRLSMLSPCVCVCQAVPVLLVRTSCEPVALLHIPVPSRAGWCLQGRLEQSGIQPAPGPPRWSPVRSLCCLCRLWMQSLSFPPCRDEGNVCVSVSVHEGTI